MNHTGPAPIILPDPRDARIAELEEKLEEANNRAAEWHSLAVGYEKQMRQQSSSTQSESRENRCSTCGKPHYHEDSSDQRDLCDGHESPRSKSAATGETPRTDAKRANPDGFSFDEAIAWAEELERELAAIPEGNREAEEAAHTLEDELGLELTGDELVRCLDAVAVLKRAIRAPRSAIGGKTAEEWSRIYIEARENVYAQCTRGGRCLTPPDRGSERG